MNFLEQLAAQWYSYNGYFVRTNIRFGRLPRGGHQGEMDVIAYHPVTKELVHIECSNDAWSWVKKREIFLTKFENAKKHYRLEFPFFKGEVKRIAVTGFSYPRHNRDKKIYFGQDIEVILVPVFVTTVSKKLSTLDPWRVGINENTYPLLRAIQQGTFYLLKDAKRTKK